MIKATSRWSTSPARKANPDCPICGREMGHIGRKTYYCTECAKEVRLFTGIPRIYDIDENGIAREVFV